MKLSKSDIDINKKLYERFLSIGIDDGWTSHDKLENFELFLKICKLTRLPIKKASVLDVGCGTGDFAYFLGRNGVKQYIGVDIVPSVVEKAKIKYPDFDFLVGDFLALDLPQFDFVFASGTLTTMFETSNYLILSSWLKKMWKTCKKGIVFNCLLERYAGDGNDEGLFLYNRSQVLEITANVDKKAKMKVVTTDAGSGDGTEEIHIFLYK